ncbi:MAG: hypothetical protein GF383_11760 [Candidatus Lokiarchaeota archaeon]|nr:hypothetical protein [Candidatus Lokiarchaeota archaeon]MBD3341456.1 hypothetical protein [Candidatus Lokiarchaeota archaeon]
MKYALMFSVLQGGVIKPIKWGRENFQPDQSIIVLDEYTPAIWLWHGSKQSLVTRRIANRQAESLKGHGYTAGESIIGSQIRKVFEIESRKLGKDPETDEINEKFEEILNRKYSKVNEFIVNFSMEGEEEKIGKLKPRGKEFIEEKESDLRAEEASILKEKPKPVQNLSSSTKPKEEPLDIKKAQYKFEKRVEEVDKPSTASKGTTQQEDLIQKMLKRIDALENKVNNLTKSFEEFKKSHNS